MTFGKIGARKMMNTAWINPYVKDGLVAMWDGVWNMGRGAEHDLSSRLWLDHISRRPFILMGPSTSFTSVGISVDMVGANMANDLVGNLPGDLNQYGWRFSEIVFTKSSSISSNTPYVLTLGVRTTWLNITGNGVGVTAESNKSFVAPGLDLSSTHFLSVAADYGDMTSHIGSAVWVNGIAADHTGPNDGWGYTRRAICTAGANYNSGGYPFIGTFHSIRLYNRVLTQNEIDANYAVDVQRFGLTA